MHVTEDLKAQMAWSTGLDADANLLKVCLVKRVGPRALSPSPAQFRLPWEEGNTHYWDGEILFACYGPQTTTETRMVVKRGCEKRTFDHKTYEEQMFYFNRVTRVQYYEHGLEAEVSAAQYPEHMHRLDHCFDCAREVQILKRYLTKHDAWYVNGERDASTSKLVAEIPEAELNKQVVALSVELGHALKRDKEHEDPAPGSGRRGVLADSRDADADEADGGGDEASDEIDYNF